MAPKNKPPQKTPGAPGTRTAASSAPRNPTKASSKPGNPSRNPPSNPPNDPIELPDGMWERIARKAYELWEQRGRRDGSHLEDWLDAEAQVMEEIHETRE